MFTCTKINVYMYVPHKRVNFQFVCVSEKLNNFDLLSAVYISM